MRFISGKQKKAINDFSVNVCYATIQTLLDNLDNTVKSLNELARVVKDERIVKLAFIIEASHLELQDSLEQEFLASSQELENEEDSGPKDSNIS